MRDAKMKSLFFICVLLVLFETTISLTREYYYVPQPMNWTRAQNYCREHYSDLATITTEEENQRARTVNLQPICFWIGLNRSAPHADTWQWSDGDKTNFTKWSPGEPIDYMGRDNCVLMCRNSWINVPCEVYAPSICYLRLTLVKENKTWEEALQHCNTYYSYLVIVDTQPLRDLLKIKTKQAETSSVWTGQRFLDGSWFWVNGEPLENQESLPQCPIHPYNCGAYNPNTNIWENRNCNEKLNFFCY